ncbi:Glypican-5 Secreted glypican-5 Precursor [Channa argus]|uniref:Glypican-5 Secreted glypican-5 n=1 Tax=Channa argus TaxID=215402 RepID=A0A6G1QA69_CHAAH|nr:Glypican-5 Secreted glypican-5 Precursor [Channa argus]
MSRGICPRVNSCGPLWILSAVIFAVNVINVDAYSCHEVKTAFQVRLIGPLQRVPDTPGTDVDLLICKHQGPSCCNRKMEESYQSAVQRDTIHNIHSYSYELGHIISGHSDAFQDMFQYLLSFSQGHLSSLLEGTYSSVSRHALPHVNQLFSSLSLYLRGTNVSVEVAVHQFFNNLFPLVYTRLINPGIDGSMMAGSEMSDCLRMIRQDVNPFGPHPVVMAQELTGALGTGRQLALALEEGLDVINATEHVSLSKECVKGLVKMVYCSHCQGLTLIKPCVGYCLNVMRGCLASLSELDHPWRKYTSLLEKLTHAMAGHHSLELALLKVRGHVNEALLYAQLHGPLITATTRPVLTLLSHLHTCLLDKLQTFSFATFTQEHSLSKRTSLQTSQTLFEHDVAGLDFFVYLQRYKSFFAALPEMLCEGENVVDDATCWSGDDVVESYSGRIVGNGLYAQRQNPEVKVRSPDPRLTKVKERLELFSQETHERFPKLSQIEPWDELSSGETEEGSTTECDDEDGCQASGDGQEKTCVRCHKNKSRRKLVIISVEREPLALKGILWIAVHPDGSSEEKPTGKQPEGDRPHDNPSKPPSVRMLGDSSSASWARPWSLRLLFATFCLQWTLF